MQTSHSQKKKKETQEKETKVQTVNMFANFEFPTITVKIHHHSIRGFQLDGGAPISPMTNQTMQDLGLTNMEPTNTILHVADQCCVKPLGILHDVQTMVVGFEFLVAYLVVRPHSYGASFSILMGRPWLLQAHCV